MVWLPPADDAGVGAGPVLPLELDSVRTLHVDLVARCQGDMGDAALGSSDRGSGSNSGSDRSKEAADCLRSAAGELHGLAWLHAAYLGVGLHGSCGCGTGQPAPPTAHLPIHAAMCAHLAALLALARPP